VPVLVRGAVQPLDSVRAHDGRIARLRQPTPYIACCIRVIFDDETAHGLPLPLLSPATTCAGGRDLRPLMHRHSTVPPPSHARARSHALGARPLTPTPARAITARAHDPLRTCANRWCLLGSIGAPPGAWSP